MADDGSTDGTREWLEEQLSLTPLGRGLLSPEAFTHAEFLPAPFGGPVAAVNVYLEDHRSPGVDILAKVDNDALVPAGWLPELLRLLRMYPDVDLLGMAPDLGPPQPCPYMERGVRYAAWVDGNGLWRHRAFDGRRLPQRTRRDDVRYGMSDWQVRHPDVVKAWASPDLPMFQLDCLPFEPWVSLATEYISRGWQRGWPNAPYEESAHEYWSWFTEAALA